MKILIIGDSFAADWTAKYNTLVGWPNLLAKHHAVVNLAQAGVGEYKIYKQLLSVADVSKFDLVIVAHTSPYRVHTRKHPKHFGDKLHNNADLMYSDIEYHLSKVGNFLNRALRSAYNFFAHHFDYEYQEDIYMLLRNKINQLVGNTKCLVVTNSTIDLKFVTENNVTDISYLQTTYPGLANHLSDIGNQLAFKQILNKINEIT
jgi:hypothetical protein